jgi:hypothetical protein
LVEFAGLSTGATALMKIMQLATAETVVATEVAGDGAAAAAAASPPQPVLHRGLLKCLLLLVVFVSLALPTTAPLSTTDMVLWLRADDVTCSADDDAVSSWADRSGQGNDASQSSAAYQPLCTQASSDLGGHSAVSFGSADSLAMMTCGSPVYANGSGITVFAVVADAAQASSATIPYVFDEGLIAGWGFGMTFSTSSLNEWIHAYECRWILRGRNCGILRLRFARIADAPCFWPDPTV